MNNFNPEDMAQLSQIMKLQQDARNKKALMGTLGGMANALTNNQSAGNYWLGKMNKPVDNSKIFNADSVGNPMAEEAMKLKMLSGMQDTRRGNEKYQTSLDRDSGESQLSADELEAYTKAFPELGPKMSGMSANQMGKLFPGMASMREKQRDRQHKLDLQRLKNKKKTGGASSRAFNLTPEQRAFWKAKGVGDEQIQMAEAGLAGRNPLNALNQISEKDEMGTTEVKKLNDFKDSRIALEKIGNDFFGDKDLVGWIDGNLPQMFSGEKVNEFRSRIGKFNDLYRKAITGTGASEMEIKNLMANLPKSNDSEAAFVGKLKSSMNDLIDQQNQYVDLLGQGGYFTGNIEKMKPYSGFEDGETKTPIQRVKAKVKETLGTADAPKAGPKDGEERTLKDGSIFVFKNNQWTEK